MLSKLVTANKSNILVVVDRFWKRFIRPTRRNYSSDKIKIIDGVCYAPVPCPEEPKAAETPEQVFTRPVRQEPGLVRFGFVPEEWFVFFHKKTGISGPYVFLVTVPTYLISKELYVMEHEYYLLLSVIMLCYLVTTRIGPNMAKYLDKEIDSYEKDWNEGRVMEKQVLDESIDNENKLQLSCAGQLILLNAKRENVALQLEAAYRQRLKQVHGEVLKRLNYQTSVGFIERRYMHKNLVEWVVDQVLKSYTEVKATENIDACIDHLSVLAAKAKKSG